jgi:N-acetyl-anhydromuramyl-L-alanine amidase AmpD
MTKLTKVNYIVIHHSAGNKKQTVEQIKNVHLKEGYSDIGYHKLINYLGQVFAGRSETEMGAQALEMNSESIGVCCIGDYQKNEPSPELYKSLVQVVATLCKRHKVPAYKIIGHRDVAKIKNKPYVATLCPGDFLYNLLQKLRVDVAKYL